MWDLKWLNCHKVNEQGTTWNWNSSAEFVSLFSTSGRVFIWDWNEIQIKISQQKNKISQLLQTGDIIHFSIIQYSTTTFRSSDYIRLCWYFFRITQGMAKCSLRFSSKKNWFCMITLYSCAPRHIIKAFLITI